MKELISKKQAEFIDRSIRLQDPDSDEFKQIAFWARVFVQASLPHSNPGKVNVWGRENGRFSLTIQPGIDLRDGKEHNFGIPYGSIPRLLMSWMCTEAVRTKNPKLFLGDSLSDFMKEVGIGAPTGGPRGTVTSLKDQMQRLFEARISYRWRGESLGTARQSIQIADKDVLFWDNKSPTHPTLFQSYIVLSDLFFKDLVDRPVPIKVEALSLLKRSPLALDLYTWLTYRVFRLEKPVFVPWTELQKQLGSEYENTKEFARKSRQQIRKIKLVYPELDIEEHRGRIEIKPSSTHVTAVPRNLPTVDKSGS